MVFDGSPLPSKKGTEETRRASREKHKAKGLALLRAGKRSEAIDAFQKAVDVTPAMAKALIDACGRAGVEVIVAPYEADAQLAHLNLSGYVATRIWLSCCALSFNMLVLLVLPRPIVLIGGQCPSSAGCSVLSMIQQRQCPYFLSM